MECRSLGSLNLTSCIIWPVSSAVVIKSILNPRSTLRGSCFNVSWLKGLHSGMLECKLNVTGSELRDIIWHTFNSHHAVDHFSRVTQSLGLTLSHFQLKYHHWWLGLRLGLYMKDLWRELTRRCTFRGGRTQFCWVSNLGISASGTDSSKPLKAQSRNQANSMKCLIALQHQ